MAGLQTLTFDFSAADPESTCLSIHNPGPHPCLFHFDLNGHFFLTEEKIKTLIFQQAKAQDTPPAQEAFTWINAMSAHVSQYYFYWDAAKQNLLFKVVGHYHAPLTEEKWLHVPALFLSSIGWGFCDDRAAILALVWQSLGYQSRLWKLHEHVVPEVFESGAWQMYDPDFGIYFCNDRGVVVDVAAIAEKQFKTAVFGANILSPADLKAIPLENQFNIEAYAPMSSNALFDWLMGSLPTLNTHFVLPPQATITLGEFNGDLSENTRLLTVTLPPEVTGEVYIPLVLFGIEGSATIILGTHRYSCESDSIQGLYNRFPEKLYVEKNPTTTVLKFRVNPRLPLFQQQNTLVLEGEHAEQLLCSHQTTQHPFPIQWQPDWYHFLRSLDLKKAAAAVVDEITRLRSIHGDTGQ